MWKKSIISIFTSQAFRGHHEDNAENRALIKINGDSISGSGEFCNILVEMSWVGNESWGIKKFELPITYGRYHNPFAKSFSREFAKQGNKFSYLYKCKSTEFQSKMLSIAEFQMTMNLKLAVTSTSSLF